MNWTFELKKPSPIKWHWVLMMTTTTNKDDETKPLDDGSEEGATSMRFDNFASFLMVWLRRSSLVSGWSRPLIWWTIARREPENSPCYYIRMLLYSFFFTGKYEDYLIGIFGARSIYHTLAKAVWWLSKVCVCITNTWTPFNQTQGLKLLCKVVKGSIIQGWSLWALWSILGWSNTRP